MIRWLFAFTLLLAGVAHAQMRVAPMTATTVPVSGTITAGNTFQSIMAADTSRVGCAIQNTSTHTMYFYVGATASATTSNSLQVAPNGMFNCQNPGGTVVVTDNIAVTTSTTNDTFAGFFQH